MGIIYQAKNTVNGKRYIGQTVRSLEDRRAGHEKDARCGSPYIFHRALRKYGFDAFEWEIVYWCPDEKLSDAESEHIAWFGSLSPGGYNLLSSGAAGRMSKESKAKISEALKGKPKSESHCKNLSKALKGRVISPEWIQKMKVAKRPPQTAEANAKRRAAMLGTKHSAETRRKISEATRGISGTLKGKTYDEIYGDRADEMRANRAKKRRVDKSPEAKRRRSLRAQKAARTRKAPKYNCGGLSLTMGEWAALSGLSKQLIHDRLRKGWSFEKAVTTPPNASRSKSQQERRRREAEKCQS